jgi:hypothetical protein
MSKQTAVEWLVYNINEISKSNDLYNGTEFIERYHMIEVHHLRLLVKDAILMEKYQIEKAYDDSVIQFDDDISSEQYYKDTYGGDDE